MEERLSDLKQWLKTLGFKTEDMCQITQDASYRRYYRLSLPSGSDPARTFVVMDAPLQYEKPDTFFRLARLMRYFGFNVPECFKHNLEQGFLVLSDFGDRRLFDEYLMHHDFSWFDRAQTILQQLLKVPATLVPDYHLSKLSGEIHLMVEWFLPWIEFEFADDADFYTSLMQAEQTLLDNARAQPAVFVYRDFHCKNLMCCDDGKLGLLDFQDAVRGPLTYDLVSLLKDCYLDLSNDYVEVSLDRFYRHVLKEEICVGTVTGKMFRRWFDLTGLQRHLKCLGIFSRQSLSRNCDAYLPYLPRVMRYIDEVLVKYPDLAAFNEGWQKWVKPCYHSKMMTLS
ncbi:MAG: aminoglycoside phosphotransferase family protein [Francisellaceae bacterium]